MRTLRILTLAVVAISIAAPAQNPPKQSGRGTTTNPRSQEPSAAANAAAATQQATNPYYNSTHPANPQNASGSNANADPASQIVALTTQRTHLVAQQTSLKSQIYDLQNSPNALSTWIGWSMSAGSSASTRLTARSPPHDAPMQMTS